MRGPCLLILLFALFSCQPKSAEKDTAFRFKEKLSDYGFFTGALKDLQPRKGVEHYELTTPLFTDYAVKDRFIVVPPGTSIQYTDHGPLDFPDSTFIIKNFAYTNPSHQRIMIETRLLFKDPADKNWKVMNYLWQEDQQDAVRWILGKKVPVTLLDDSGAQHSTTYQVPNTNDCKRCHINNSVLTPIGPKARNLNFAANGAAATQLEQWAANGLLKGLPAPQQVPRLPDWKDSVHFTVSQRARAYLDVNCAHCHTKGGDAYNTGLFLEYEQTDPNHLGIMKAPVSAGGGAGGLDIDVIPGDAIHSILWYRMNSTEPGTAMPELARTLIHKEGVVLIGEWIRQMKK
ncbi:SO2930 family diheme c-type cytochrome [Chitinophaga solisilvae]|uniref:SO2930 family diheme c-type cytochrome n=1 Tax=Chitinophaga solisilvae TaxID=1233460 RepID=UPI001368103E|nr:SO2930 family diheme c-type cytochrome [Chitinophaga solisilvae]